jgi:hypothetical protein
MVSGSGKRRIKSLATRSEKLFLSVSEDDCIHELKHVSANIKRAIDLSIV